MSENGQAGYNPAELMMSDAYNALLKDAETDRRVGDHEAVVAKVTYDQWPSGDPRQKVDFLLVTANNFKADLTLSPPPPPDIVAQQKDSWEPGKVKAIANAISIYRQIIQHYPEVKFDAQGRPIFREGDHFKVKTTKTKRNDDGSGGFVRVIAFLDKDRQVGSQVASAGSGPAPAF